MLSDYLQAALHTARYEILPEDGTFYAEIPLCNGVFANAETLKGCRAQLAEVLEDWILLRVHRHRPLPEIGGITLFIPNPHGGDISRSLLARILRQAQIPREQWDQL